MALKTKSLLTITLFLVIFATASGIIINNIKFKTEQINYKIGSSYPDDWKKVEELEGKGLPQSALDVVQQIYKKAKSENNYAQMVKALLYISKYTIQTDDNGVINSILKFEAEADSAKFPLKPVLHSILGDFFWQYYSQNRYVIYKRTNTGDFRPNDIATWDAKRLIEESIKYYNLSIQNLDSLQRTDLKLFDDILYTYPGSKTYRYTLFDFLANRAIDFYMNSEAEITRPSFEYNLNDENLLLPYKKFIAYKIRTNDSISLKYQAIITLQKLIDFHSNDNKKYALIDADLKRLKFVYNNTFLNNKDSLYNVILNNYINDFNADSACADVYLSLGELYFQLGETYQPQVNIKYKSYLVKSLNIANECIKKYPSTNGAYNCEVLKNNILSKSFDFVTEKNQLPEKPLLARLNYKNIDSLYFKIIKVDWEKDREKTRNTYDSSFVSYYLKRQSVKTFNISLPDSADYHDYSTEFIIPPLPIGQYIVIASYKHDFKWHTNAFAYSYLNITNLSYLSRRYNNENMEFIVLNRNNGNAEQNVTAQLWKEEYNYTSQKYNYIKSSSYTSDANGKFVITSPKDYRYFFVELIKGNDHFISDESFYQYHYYPYENKITPRIFFFTDRAIYRPGQTLYFKGIVINTDGVTNKIIPNFATTVVLYDANYQKVEELKVTSNEYGSISGTFTLPTGLLNGQMSISASGYGTQYFSVEEYKRPKFEVQFDTIKETFKLNSQVNIKGNAKAYAGSVVDNANVKYKISRKYYFPYRWWYWWSYPAQNNETIMSYGTTTTDSTGNFVLTFDALPDLNINPKYNPAFTYSVSVDVTDINGETHSNSTFVNVGYKSLVLSTNWGENVNLGENKGIEVIAKNLNGDDVKSSGKITIYKLIQPQKIYQTRSWNIPDVYTISKSEFEKTFPQFAYKTEDKPETWSKNKLVFETEFNTQTAKKINIPNIQQWEQGYYYVEINSKDKFGEDVKYQNYVICYNPTSSTMPFSSESWFNALKNNCEPGEKASFLIGSSLTNLKVLYEIEHKGKIVKSDLLTLNNEQKIIEIPVTETQRGNFSVHFLSVNNNRTNVNSDIITVPFTNKELDISFESFRNKLYPGEQEEWKILIKGKKSDKVAAEMVATLYDASLDAFKPQNWGLALYPGEYTSLYWSQGQSFANTSSAFTQINFNKYLYYSYRSYDYLNYFGLQNYFYTRNNYYGWLDDGIVGGNYKDAEEISQKDEPSAADTKGRAVFESKVACDKNEATSLPVTSTGDLKETEKSGKQTGADNNQQIQARKNFSETAFFYPNLKTNENGEVIVSFKVPESLTKWKMLGLAHTKDLRIGTITNELVTQKELMVIPNLPRFMRENDEINITSKISNLSDSELNGQAQLYLYDAITNKPIDNIFNNNNPTISFSSKKGQSVNLSWKLNVPEGINAITCKIVAKAGKYSDGEENAIPVLSNRMLVTESLPLPIRGKTTKIFKFEKLLNSGSSNTIKHQKVTLEFTANPAWYAVQALPYIIEYPYECAEQVFSRYYGNKLASHIANSKPKIKAVFDSWKNTPDSKALISNLDKNQELKDLLLQETPWVLDSKDETTRKHRIGLLFDLNTMSNNLNSAFNKLEKLQCSNGGFMWFSGMPDDRYITQHIITGFAHLNHLNVINLTSDYKAWNMTQKGVRYLDNEMRKDYEWMKKHYTKKEMDENHLSYIDVQYLYMRSYFVDKIELSSSCKEAFDYFKLQSQKYWLQQNKYMQGMVALALYRFGDKEIPNKILASLKEYSLNSEELGMYWKENSGGYYWWEAPIETQALLIEAFDEISGDQKTVDDLKVWLLKQKQTQDWKTTKATTEAIYALLLRGSDWLATEPNIEITVGNNKINPKNMPDQKAEAGTGYIKTSWSGSDIKPEMGNVTVVKGDEGVSWGALYWQYFEQLDKITSHETPLKLNKKLFIENTTVNGKVLNEIKPATNVKVGDKVIVRIELRVDRDMQYVHMKDMRAAGFEPINVISTYKWQDGLGYYESTKDASTNFFFSYLPKGTYVFEYPVRASLAGNFSNGISSIQCMYAPEFTSHSEGIRVIIK